MNFLMLGSTILTSFFHILSNYKNIRNIISHQEKPGEWKDGTKGGKGPATEGTHKTFFKNWRKSLHMMLRRRKCVVIFGIPKAFWSTSLVHAFKLYLRIIYRRKQVWDQWPLHQSNSVQFCLRCELLKYCCWVSQKSFTTWEPSKQCTIIKSILKKYNIIKGSSNKKNTDSKRTIKSTQREKLH